MFKRKTTQSINILITTFALCSFSTGSLASDQHEHEQTAHVEIDTETAIENGIKTGIAGSNSIATHLQAYGRLVTPADQTIQVRARFPGVINSAKFNVGDYVKKGQTLAIIESNESLQTYEIRSPINAIVQARTANSGEATTDNPLFTLVNNDSLWVELKLFPSQRNAVKVAQGVAVSHIDHIHNSTIDSITPTQLEQPYVLARAALDNTNGEMAPGDLVSGKIIIEQVRVALAVDNRALHSFNDKTVVFVKQGDTYTAQPLTLGRSDGLMTEVLAGIRAGDQYVVENSYLIKADILKSNASHDH